MGCNTSKDVQDPSGKKPGPKQLSNTGNIGESSSPNKLLRKPIKDVPEAELKKHKF